MVKVMADVINPTSGLRKSDFQKLSRLQAPALLDEVGLSYHILSYSRNITVERLRALQGLVGPHQCNGLSVAC